MDINIPRVQKVVSWGKRDHWFGWLMFGPIHYLQAVAKDNEQYERLKTLWFGGVSQELSKAYVALKSIRRFSPTKGELVVFHKDCDTLVNHLYVAYRSYLKDIVLLIDPNLSFMFGKQSAFESGMRKYMAAQPKYELFLRWFDSARRGFLNDFSKLRTEIEHPTRSRSAGDDIYNKKAAEQHFRDMCFIVEETLMSVIDINLGSSLKIYKLTEPNTSRGYEDRYGLFIIDLTSQQSKAKSEK